MKMIVGFTPIPIFLDSLNAWDELDDSDTYPVLRAGPFWTSKSAENCLKNAELKKVKLGTKEVWVFPGLESYAFHVLDEADLCLKLISMEPIETIDPADFSKRIRWLCH